MAGLSCAVKGDVLTTLVKYLHIYSHREKRVPGIPRPGPGKNMLTLLFIQCRTRNTHRPIPLHDSLSLTLIQIGSKENRQGSREIYTGRWKQTSEEAPGTEVKTTIQQGTVPPKHP